MSGVREYKRRREGDFIEEPPKRRRGGDFLEQDEKRRREGYFGEDDNPTKRRRGGDFSSGGGDERRDIRPVQDEQMRDVSGEGDTYTSHRYIHINSKHLNFQDKKTDFEVGLITPIRNVRRMCLRSFSAPNTGFNFVSGKNHFRWVEFRKDSAGVVEMKGFSVSIPSGYYTGTQFASAFNAQITALNLTGTHTFGTETNPAQVVMTYSSVDFHLTLEISLITGSQNKWFALIQDDAETNDWRRSGFEKHQTISYDTSAFQDGNGVFMFPDGDLFTHYEGIQDSTSYADINDRVKKITSTAKLLKGALEALIENRMGFYLTTSLSINDVYETHRRLGKNLADQTDILAWVQNQSSRFSYIHHEPQTPQYHVVHQDSISNFRIQVRDEDGRVLEESEMRDFVLSLDFEVEEHQPYSNEFLAKRYADAYRQGHPTKALA